MNRNPENNDPSTTCWNCVYFDMSGVYFPGRCNWFKDVKKEEPKEIPGKVVDIGCKFFSSKDGSNR